MECSYKTSNFKRKFGIEIEIGNEIKKNEIRSFILDVSDKTVYVSRYDISTDNSYWHIKDDSTCGKLGKKGPKGIEIASFVGYTIKDLKHIAKTSQYLLRKNVCVNDNCGLHYHFDASDLSPEQVGKILYFWIKLEPFMSLGLPKRRIANYYCKMYCDLDLFYLLNTCASEDFVNYKKVYEIFKPTDFSYNQNDDRKKNLNLVNYARCESFKINKRKTIEFRWPEGSLKSQDIKNWGILFSNFINSAIHREKIIQDPKTLYDYLYILGFKDEKITILSKDLYQAKAWFLNRIIKNLDFDTIHRIFSDRFYLPYKKDVEDNFNLISTDI